MNYPMHLQKIINVRISAYAIFPDRQIDSIIAIIKWCRGPITVLSLINEFQKFPFEMLS